MAEKGAKESGITVVDATDARASALPKSRVGSPEWTRRFEEECARQEAAKVYQLAFWADDKRAMPTDFLACALFAAVHGKNARHVRGEQIASVNGYNITFTGRRLTQVHADIVMGALQLMRGLPQGNQVVFRSRSFLRLIGRSTGKSDRDSLRQLVDDLIATTVRITTPDGKDSYAGSILTKAQDVAIDSEDSVFALEVNRELAKLFERGFGTIDWEKRQKLMRKPLALWLQLYFSTFTKPVAIAELHRLSGSTSELKDFRRKLRAALDELDEHGVAFTRLDTKADTVHLISEAKRLAEQKAQALVESSASASQPTFPGFRMVTVGKRALATFRKLFPEHSAEECLADFQRYLAKPTTVFPENQDGAFIGFAKVWVKDR